MGLSSWMRRFSLLAGASIAALSCGGSSGSGSSIAGSSCDPTCVGYHCDRTCDGDLVFSCDRERAVWTFEENCRAFGQTCHVTELAGGPDVEVVCADAPPGGGDTGGKGGLGGAAGTGGGGSAGRSLGTVDIAFSVEDAGAYCHQGDTCGTGPTVSITNAAGETLKLSVGWCPTYCSDCVPQPCPGLACMPIGLPVEGAGLTWDGSYYVSDTCGAGSSCVSERYAPAGRYTARFCATRGTLQTSSDTGQAECLVTGQPECIAVEFDYPASGSVEAALPGGAGGSGAGATGGSPGTGASGGTGGTLCSGADSNGFFDSCDACPTTDCETLTVGSTSRMACGCSGGCPCGFSCGSHEIAPGISVGDICVR